MAGNERAPIRALQEIARGGFPNRTWGHMLTGTEAWKNKGSDNHVTLAYACEFITQENWSSEKEAATAWWHDWADSQEDGAVGHCNRELGSRIYDSWIAVPAAMVLRYAPADLEAKLRMWMRRHWILQSLGAVDRTQGLPFQVSGASVSWTGMRSCAKKGGARVIRDATSSVDAIFCEALGITFASRRKWWELDVAKKADLGLSKDEKEFLVSFVSGGTSVSSLFERFREEISGIATRVPMRIVRWKDGSVGTLVERDCGTSTPPVYGMLLRGSKPREAEYLCPYRAGEKYTHGEAWDMGDVWRAEIPARVEELPLPQGERMYTVLIDRTGMRIDGAPTVIEPDDDGDLPAPEQSPIERHLQDAMTLLSYPRPDDETALRHVQRAESLLVERIRG